MYLLVKHKMELLDINQTLRTSLSMQSKCMDLEISRIKQCFDHTLDVLLNADTSILITGSAAEGTDITPEDYGKTRDSLTSKYLSDTDAMSVLYHVRVNDEGGQLPQKLENYIYCSAERGKHTTAGFRKLRIIHDPKHYTITHDQACYWANIIHASIENEYISSTKFVALLLKQIMNIPCKHSVQKGISTQGPSHVMVKTGITGDFVRCFYVKTWPQEAEAWFTRQTHWPDRKLKHTIKNTGYLLVPTGKCNSKESNLEWRCSFSIAEKILFQSMTKFERCTFLNLKVLLKEHLSSDINTDGEKQLLSTYHIKTLFLWCLEDSNLRWVSENMLVLDAISDMLNKLMIWIHNEHFPHYFIQSINLFDGKQLHGRKTALIHAISAIRNELSNTIRQSPFFMVQRAYGYIPDYIEYLTYTKDFIHLVFHTYKYDTTSSIAGRLQDYMHSQAFHKIQLFRQIQQVKFSHSLLIEEILQSMIQLSNIEHLYTAIYSDPIHSKLLTEVVPGLINQYLGCIHLVKYCIAKRDGHILPHVLHTAESLLKDTINIDPCSGHVKLACLYIYTHEFVQAIAILEAAENNFSCKNKIMNRSALRASERGGKDRDKIISEIFHKWAEGMVSSDIVVSWLEYNMVPDILQFELIQESTQQIIDIPELPEPGKMVGVDCHLKWSPLSLIRLLKFVCAFNSEQSSICKMENLVRDLIASGMSLLVLPVINDIYTVFNMAAWCYLKIKQNKKSAHMMRVAIESSSEKDIMKRCAFSHHFVSYVIAQCLL